MGYLGTFVVGLIAYAVFAAYFPDVAAKISEMQTSFNAWVKAKISKTPPAE